MAGDGGPNVQAAKIRLVKLFPWLLNIYDPCHNLNLFLKDLGKLFKEVGHVLITIHYGRPNIQILSLAAFSCFGHCQLFWKVKSWNIPS